jgi:hypothetical protein
VSMWFMLGIMEPLLSYEQAAAELGLTTRSLRELVRKRAGCICASAGVR